MRVKICGMKYPGNMMEVATLRPDYLGFIFYEPSSRFFEGSIPGSIDLKRVGVFVNAERNNICQMIHSHQLNAVQLHGHESPEYCEALRSEINSEGYSRDVEIIKAFAVYPGFDFDALMQYENCCDYFLFDAKGELPGGNGVVFDWRLLENYNLQKPFFLSGGIGPESVEELEKFTKSGLAEFCYAVDVNSGFEEKPGLKNVKKLKHFIESL